MSDPKKLIIEGLQQAIRNESDGYHFYTMAAGNIKDEKGQEIFETLALEERAHMSFLKKQHQSLVETGRVDKTISLGTPAELKGENPIFSEAIKNRISDAHFEMSALSIGIQLELNSQQYYKKQSDLADIPEVRAFYDRLSDWESGHYHALLRQQESLKEDYWAGGGFAPF
ncbi:MAG TPA: ferritin family protein [Myxococcota bacterium]|nr:ferritin family protein [Myxococcota bacterium]